MQRAAFNIWPAGFHRLQIAMAALPDARIFFRPCGLFDPLGLGRPVLVWRGGARDKKQPCAACLAGPWGIGWNVSQRYPATFPCQTIVSTTSTCSPRKCSQGILHPVQVLVRPHLRTADRVSRPRCAPPPPGRAVHVCSTCLLRLQDRSGDGTSSNGQQHEVRLEAPLHMHAFTLGPSAACYISHPDHWKR